MIKRIQLLSLSCDLKTEEGIRHFHNGHEYVEVGGIKWATMNVGAEKPTDCGLYFQWGDTQGYTADQVGKGQKHFSWVDYKYSDGTILPSPIDITKYNYTDGKKVLDLEDDAARANWGGSWRMPTIEEMKSFRDAVSTEFKINYNGSGVNGLLCTDKTDSSKTLFFPAAGYAISGVMSVNRYGGYWSSSLYTSNTIVGGRDLFFDIAYCNIGICSRCYGFSVRGVIG